MNVTTLGFLTFLSIFLIVFYAVPQTAKWKLLLIASLAVIANNNIKDLLFIALTAFTIWAAALKMEQLEEQQNTKASQKQRKQVLLIAMAVNFGILIGLKYLAPILHNTTGNSLFAKVFVPLGLSYYTLQAVSYILDVYWGRIHAEKNYAKLLLFVCYFPQMLQGPISRYKDLSHELTEKDLSFRIVNLKHGVQLMLWGYFKVMVIALRAETFVKRAFYGSETAYGVAAFVGLMTFGIQLYANFSGGIDIIRGISQCLGISLPDNFRQPFFSVSIGDFWRRWHITLGSWMKDYVFYPFSMSHAISRLKKKLKKHVSRKMANRIPMAIADIVVFLLVGIWHGLGTNYVIWGLYNGLILAFSELMTDCYRKANDRFSIYTNTEEFHLFRILRTFILVTLGWCTDCASTAGDSLGIIRNLFMVQKSNMEIFQADSFSLKIMLFCVVVLLVVDILHEKKISIRNVMDHQNIAVQMVFWTVLIQLIALFAEVSMSGGFMYANF